MMPIALLAAAVATAPVQVNELVLEAEDFRIQTIRKAQGEQNWPFVVEKECSYARL